MTLLRSRRDWNRDIDITRRVLRGDTMGQIGRDLGMTRERVRQIMKRCVKSARLIARNPYDPRFDDISPRSMRNDRLFWSPHFEALAQVHGIAEAA